VNPIRFAIIGAGNIAPLHARSIAEIDGACLVAVTDIVGAKARKLADEYGARAFTDLTDMLNTCDLDAVCLCVPSGARCEIAEVCSRAGKHVLSEKPLEVTTERCDRIINAADQANVILGCVFQNRFTDSAQAVRAAFDAGRFGRPLLGNAYVKWNRSQEYYDKDAWRGTWELDGGGVLMNQGIHYIDILLWIMGPVRRVAAKTRTMAHDNLEVEDLACATLEFENGALGTIEGSTGIWRGHPSRVEIHGTLGTAVIEDGKLVEWSFSEELPEDQKILDSLGKETTIGSAAGDPIAGLNYDGHRRQIEDFVSAIQTGKKPLVEGREARIPVGIIQAIYRAARTGEQVDI
jgi:UDP-N-acetyl-2-amino-2-deoxyglucuronate dehydrogenase